MFFCYLYNGYSRIGYGSQYSRTSWQFAADTRYSMQVEFTTNGVVKAARSLGSTANDKTTGEVVDTRCNLYLFACNVAGTVTGKASARLYSTKIWQTDGNGVY